MAYFALTDNFRAFFGNINPSQTKVTAAAREHGRIKELLEDSNGPAGVISPECFLQGSYKQDTAIHDINDVDIVALCTLWQPSSGSSSPGTKSYGRDEIFRLIAAAVGVDSRYRGKITYTSNSMCVKVEADTRVEILPVVYKSGTYDSTVEPFRLYRPAIGQWEDGYARYHQKRLSEKNSANRTGGNFIPAIKVLKHLRTRYGLDSISFHIECLLHYLPDATFLGSASDYIPAVLAAIANTPADTWYAKFVHTPCGERDIFTSSEWNSMNWKNFHKMMQTLSSLAASASNTVSREQAIHFWQTILGDDYFPHL